MQTRRILHALARYNRFANGRWDVDAIQQKLFAMNNIHHAKLDAGECEHVTYRK